MLKYCKGFTLAEVLITLGIIGIVAAMTMPTLIQKNNEKVTVTKLKKMYSILSQAYLYSVEKYGTPDMWGFGDRDEGAADEEDTDYIAQNSLIVRDKLFENVKNLTKCDNSLNKDNCGLANEYIMENGGIDTGLRTKTSGLASIDGNNIIVIANNATCSEVRGISKSLRQVCAIIYVDINGSKEPNTHGKDVFSFYLTKNGIISVGTQDETAWSFEKGSLGRTAWVIANENMDYLRCPDELGWDKKSKCN